MRQVRVGLDHVAGEVLAQDFFHRIAACRSIAAFARTCHQVNVTVALLNAADLIRGAVGRIVVHKKNRFVSDGLADSGDEDRNISPFVIGGDDQHWAGFPKCVVIMCRIGNPTGFSGSDRQLLRSHRERDRVGCLECDRVRRL